MATGEWGGLLTFDEYLLFIDLKNKLKFELAEAERVCVCVSVCGGMQKSCPTVSSSNSDPPTLLFSPFL